MKRISVGSKFRGNGEFEPAGTLFHMQVHTKRAQSPTMVRAQRDISHRIRSNNVPLNVSLPEGLFELEAGS